MSDVPSAKGAAVIAASALVMAVPYAAALVYNPRAYLGILLPAAMGAALGAIGAIVASVRVGVLAAMACWLSSWVPWTYFTLSHVGHAIDVRALLWPPTFLQLFGALYENGAWTIGRSGEPVAGASLAVVWLGEVGVVLISSAVVARSFARR